MHRANRWHDRLPFGRDDRAGCHQLARNPHATYLTFRDFGLGFRVLGLWVKHCCSHFVAARSRIAFE